MTVIAKVQNSNCALLTYVVVTFTTTRGTISPAQVGTSANGIASATLTATDTADVTASVGPLLSALKRITDDVDSGLTDIGTAFGRLQAALPSPRPGES